MILNESQKKELDVLSRPHVKIIVDAAHAELLEGICTFRTNDYIKD